MSMPVPVHYIFKPKKVQLTDGNLVLDTPVPTSYLSAVDFQTGHEFETMRYMAVTCDADFVPERHYKLRTHNLKRSIELAVCLTVNEVLLKLEFWRVFDIEGWFQRHDQKVGTNELYSHAI